MQTHRDYVAEIGAVIGRRIEFVDLDERQAWRELSPGLPEEVGTSIIRDS